jgi:hypothetical protein
MNHHLLHFLEKKNGSIIQGKFGIEQKLCSQPIPIKKTNNHRIPKMNI